MKMKDLDEQVSLEAQPDFGKFSQDDIMRSIKKKDSADDDEAGMAADYTQIASQAAQFSDLPKGGTIETTDGQQVEVTQDEAKFLARFTGREVARLYDLFGVKPAYGNDPDAMEKAQKIFASSKGLMAVLNKVRK